MKLSLPARAGRWRLAAALAAFLLLLTPSLSLAQATGEAVPGQTCGLDFSVPAGRFFTQTAGDSGGGFNVVDDQQARFWTAFQALGGVDALGYPISERFTLRGFLVQAFQKAVLQWDATNDRVNVANTMDTLHESGFDDWLIAFRQVPAHQVLAEDEGATFQQAVQNHLAILEANPDIRDVFLSTPDWLTRLGLPIAYVDFGAVRVLRTQRAVLQQWTADVPWASAGQVILANSGELAREAGLLPATALAPVTPLAPADLGALVNLDPETPRPGDTLALTFAGGHPGLALTWDGQRLPLVCQAGQWHALAGLSPSAEPGERTLDITLGEAAAQRAVLVAERNFPSETIVLPEPLHELLDPEIGRQEGAFFQVIVSQVSGPPRWAGVFQAPVTGRSTSGYGERRILEPGSIPSVHQGADIAVPLGTPIAAPGRGVVAWSGLLSIRGNAVIIDHGFGVFTAFLHLDRIDVATGDEIAPGQVIGAVGSTGRSTGPHLHWEVYVQGAAVDPDVWTRRPFGAVAGWTAFVPPDATPAPSAGEQPPAPAEGQGESAPADPEAGDQQPDVPAPGNGSGGGDTGVPPAEGPAG